MNNTLKNLALLSFKRKARKISRKIKVIDSTRAMLNKEHLIRSGETLIVWNDENGFYSVTYQNDCKLTISLPPKYANDKFIYLGILNKEKTELEVFHRII